MTSKYCKAPSDVCYYLLQDKTGCLVSTLLRRISAPAAAVIVPLAPMKEIAVQSSLASYPGPFFSTSVPARGIAVSFCSSREGHVPIAIRTYTRRYI